MTTSRRPASILLVILGQGMGDARGKGISFNSLLPTDIDHIDMISTALDHCVEVKVYKAAGSREAGR